ncbi:MAG: serine protease [Bacteroidales bacterium]|jgi:S1-C subfamily serine protease
MFSKAYDLASKYTHPVIVSMRFFNGEVKSGLGSFVIINDDGWILTAAHILDPAFAHKQHQIEIKNYNEQIDAIKSNEKLNEKLKQRQLKKLRPNNQWITNYSFWWGHDLFVIKHFEILRENDFAIGKIENYDKKFQIVYPKFKKPDNLKNGTSLCKLGYPFYEVKTEFVEENNSFKLDPNVFPVPRFPIDGIFTRNILAGRSKDNKFDIKYLETSTPGLKGQSGGPTFDVEGNLWAIQSRTQHLNLGFAPKIKKDKKEVEENQFLNVGWGAHIDTIIKFLEDKKVNFELNED